VPVQDPDGEYTEVTEIAVNPAGTVMFTVDMSISSVVFIVNLYVKLTVLPLPTRVGVMLT